MEKIKMMRKKKRRITKENQKNHIKSQIKKIQEQEKLKMIHTNDFQEENG